jgi:cyclopropane fatty-acyl-phospholipid synthase-like methyltransferase
MLHHIFYELFYIRRPPWDTGVSPPELMEFINAHPPGRALDLGCGTGTNAITLAQHGWQATGVDFVGRAIRSARRKAKQAGVRAEFRQGDVTRLDGVRGPFELVLDIGCLHSLTPQQKAAYIENLRRLLAPGGTFLLYGFITQVNDGQFASLNPSDLDRLSSFLRLVQRIDGSERGQRASAWLTYQL